MCVCVCVCVCARVRVRVCVCARAYPSMFLSAVSQIVFSWNRMTGVDGRTAVRVTDIDLTYLVYSKFLPHTVSSSAVFRCHLQSKIII